MTLNGIAVASIRRQNNYSILLTTVNIITINNLHKQNYTIPKQILLKSPLISITSIKVNATSTKHLHDGSTDAFRCSAEAGGAVIDY